MNGDDDEIEESRPIPSYRVLVHHDNGTEIDVTNAVIDVYDIAVGSMDFGSGFLSSDEVGNLRALGKAIGAQRFDYQHDRCLRCGHEYRDHPTINKECCFGAEWPITYSVPSITTKRVGGCDCPGFVAAIEH